MIIGIYAPVLWKGKWDFYQGLTEVVKKEQIKDCKVVKAGDLSIMVDYGDRASEYKPTENCDTRKHL